MKKLGLSAAGAAALGMAFALGTPATSAQAEQVSLWVAITPAAGSTFAGPDGVTHQVWQRFGDATDEAHMPAAFYTDSIAYRIGGGVISWESNGKYVFPDKTPGDNVEDAVFLRTIGSIKVADLAAGKSHWDLWEITGGTGRFANVKPAKQENFDNDYAGPRGGCINPQGDPQGFPNVVLCKAVLDLN